LCVDTRFSLNFGHGDLELHKITSFDDLSRPREGCLYGNITGKAWHWRFPGAGVLPRTDIDGLKRITAAA
jgi:hypothetical protein